MKTCTKCKVEREIGSFYKHKKSGTRPECINCSKAQVRQWRQKYPERATISWRKANNKYYKQNPSKMKDYDLRRTYGITLIQYKAMSENQGHVCAICKEPQKNKYLAVDHNHTTGKVRGLLCDSCNQGIGKLKDSVGVLTNAVSYLLGDL